jgi:hypothetical protein
MPEPHAEIARRTALSAEEIMPDTGPGMEWYRELDDEDAGPQVVCDG